MAEKLNFRVEFDLTDTGDFLPGHSQGYLAQTPNKGNIGEIHGFFDFFRNRLKLPRHILVTASTGKIPALEIPIGIPLYPR